MMAERLTDQQVRQLRDDYDDFNGGSDIVQACDDLLAIARMETDPDVTRLVEAACNVLDTDGRDKTAMADLHHRLAPFRKGEPRR
jgi:hypothetical protein